MQNLDKNMLIGAGLAILGIILVAIGILTWGA
jgi:hypothetical protein